MPDRRRPLLRGSVALACLLAAASFSATGCAASTTPLRIAAPGQAPVRPLRALTYTAGGIEEVRRIARDTERGKALADDIFQSAAPWLAMPETRLRALVPPADMTVAYGTAGDPRTGQSWPRFGRSGDVSSLERPGVLRSPHTGDLYGNAKAGEPYYDPGDGWVRPSDGKRFYFKGIWNAWIVQHLHDAADDLALAYMLGGDEAAARRAMLILDAMAALKAARGEEPGFPDVPGYGTENKYFLAYAGNGANQRMYQTALTLDLLGRSAAAGAPSPTMPGKTMLENVRDNYFGLYELLYKQSRHTLYNHTTSLYANQIAQAVLFGKPEELREGLDVVTAWLDQCLTRDGQYYENAGGYERVGVAYFATMMLPLENYDPAKYPNPQAFPQPEEYPFALRFGNDPRWYSAGFTMKYRMLASGRQICLGDMWEDRLVLPGQFREWDARLWCAWARHLHHQTDRPEWKKETARRYWDLPAEFRDEPVISLVRRMGMSQWLEPPRPNDDAPSHPGPLEAPSDFLPGKMMAFLRSGKQADRRAAYISGSVHYSHGHDDQMSIILYDKGMCLTGIYGYPYAGSPAHRGWCIKPASKWSLVVNEDLPAVPYPAKAAPPATLQGLVTERAGASAQCVEMSNPQLWHERIAPDMKEYRRLLWLVDVSDGECYFLDFFRATGGHTHDYLWTGQWLDRPRPSEGFALEGVRPKPEPGVWSLAGANPHYRAADYNVPGRSWGERLESGGSGRIASLGIPGEAINVNRTWCPPPGNGYGFIYDVRSTTTTTDWSASWQLLDGKHTMRLTFLNDQPHQAITAKSPAFEAKRYHCMAIARRQGPSPLQSRFAGLVEVAAPGRWPVRQVRRLGIDADRGMGVALSLADGRNDSLMAGAQPDSLVQGNGVTMRGARGFVRRDAEGNLLEMLLHEGTTLETGPWRLSLASPAWEARVMGTHPDAFDNYVVVDAPLPTGARQAGSEAIFRAPAHALEPKPIQHETYFIESVTRQHDASILHFGAQRLATARATVQEIDDDNGAVKTTWPNEIRGGRRGDTGYFTGREVVALNAPERKTLVAAYPDRKSFDPADKGTFRAGDYLEFRAIREGDIARIPARAALRRESAGAFSLTANADVQLRLPAPAGRSLWLVSQGQARQIASESRGVVECRVRIEDMPEGKARLEFRPTP